MPASTSSHAPHAAGLAETLSTSMRVIITIAVLSATIMEVLDTSIVNVALPDMMGNLGATLDQIGWVSTSYIIANVIVLPLTGWLSEYFGRKRYLSASVVLFTLASVGCGLAGSLPMLIAFRVLQGAGGAAFLSTAQATMIEIYPKRLQGFAQAMFGMGVILAPTLGPTIGGIITDRYAWPWIFFVNVPVGIVATILTVLYVPDTPGARARRPADFLGIALLALGLGSLQTLLERGERDDWFDATYLRVLAGASIAALVGFVWWELRARNRNPAVNLRVLKDRNLFAGSAWAVVLGFVLYGGVFALPQFFQGVQRHTAEQSGLLMMPGGIATGVCMIILGRIVTKVDVRVLIGTGMCLVVVSMFQLAGRMDPQAPDAAFLLPQVLRGFGIGLQFVPLSLAALGTLPREQLGEGAGLYNLFRQLGGSFGIAALTTLLDRRMQSHYAHLGEYVSNFHPEALDRLAAIQAALVARGMPAGSAREAALRAVAGEVSAQAALLTYQDIFRTMGYVALGALLLLSLFKRARTPAGAMAAAH